MRRIAHALLAFTVALPLCAQSRTSAPNPLDATWTKSYATSCGPTMHLCKLSGAGNEDDFNSDPRLPALLRSALPQRESWWANGHAASAPVRSIVQGFLGITDDLLLDDDRYFTATGCVPHDCTTNGMLWIDTGAQPAVLVFVAEDPVEGFKGAGYHLWLYASKPLNFEALPPDLLANLQRWHSNLVESVQKLPESLREVLSQRVAIATLVQPDGRMHDLTYDMLFYKQNEPQFSTPGVTQP